MTTRDVPPTPAGPRGRRALPAGDPAWPRWAARTPVAAIWAQSADDARVHAATIRAQAEAELAALRTAPQIPRCRSGVHVGGAGCYQHADPRNRGDHLPVDVQGPPAMHAIDFETWAATRPIARAGPVALETWAART